LAQLRTMKVPALHKLRDQVNEEIAARRQGIERQLAALDGRFVGNGRGTARKGSKAPPKYRDKEGNTWSGRGLMAGWLKRAIKGGAKAEDFLIKKK
jgi:DNA-binding protein H-NS